MTYTEAWDMPVEIRRWWCEKKSKEKEKQSEQKTLDPRAGMSKKEKKK